jgi:hypothetical protein
MNRRVLLLSALLASGAVVGVACVGSLGTPAQSDADAGESRDGGGTTESSLPPPEASVGDGGADGSAVPHFVDGWSRAAWASSQCEVYVAPEPASAAVPPLTWRPCSSGRAGCQELALDWASSKYAAVYSLSGGKTATGRARLFFARTYSPYQIEYVEWTEESGVVAAWRDNGAAGCLMIPPASTPDGVVALTAALLGANERVQEYRQVVGTSAQLLTKTQADYVFSNADIGGSDALVMSQSSANGNVVTMEFGQSNNMAVRDRSRGTVDAMGHAYVHTGQSIVNSSVFFAGTSSVQVWNAGGGGATALVARASAVAHDVASDGQSIVWIESSNPDGQGRYQTAALFSSPFASTVAGIASSHVLDVKCTSLYCATTLSDGFVTARGAGSESIVVRLSNGAVSVLAPLITSSVSEVWDSPGFVINGDVWQSWANLLRVSGKNQGIQRISVGALPDAGP